MRVNELFESVLLEFKSLQDYRHQNIEDKFKFWGSIKDPQYIAPENGFHWVYDKGRMILASTSNDTYSAIASSDLWPKVASGEMKVPDALQQLNIKSDLWNMLGGMVDFNTKTITIAKESAGNGYRMRVIYDTKNFQQALADLMKYGVTADFVIKGTNKPFNGATVGEVLKMKGDVERMIQTPHPVMYHGTSKKRWDEHISRTGLQPGKTGQAYNDLIAGYSEFNVYLAGDMKTAEFYGKRQAKKDDDTQYVILAVTVPDTAKLLPDDEWGHGMVNGRVKNDQDVYTLIKRSIRTNGSLAYRGTIRPSFIKLVATRKA